MCLKWKKSPRQINLALVSRILIRQRICATGLESSLLTLSNRIVRSHRRYWQSFRSSFSRSDQVTARGNFLHLSLRSEPDRHGINEEDCRYNENVGYVIYSASGSFYLPMLVILYTYARIICLVQTRNKELKEMVRVRINYYTV